MNPAPTWFHGLAPPLPLACSMRGILTRIRRPRTPLAVLGLATMSAAVLGAAAGRYARVDLPSLAALEDFAPPEMTRILARDGTELVSYAAEKRILLAHDGIPESFRQALIASEDARFLEHPGVDPRGALRALWTDLRTGELTQGASTLTMQLAGNLFLDRRQRTWRRKLQEALLALEIERRFSKSEILRMYCNQVHFGHGLYGLEAAARYYFGKPARTLSLLESATLVGILPRPASYSPLRNPDRATRRRDLVLRRMVAEGYLTTERSTELAAEPLAVHTRKGSQGHEDYFTEDVRRWLQETYGNAGLYRGGMEVRTTLDPVLQQAATVALQRGLRELAERQGQSPDEEPRVEGALVALDPRDGEVLALVGGYDFVRSEYNRATQSRRQPGSLFKPLVFAAALAEGWTLADSLIDEPTVFLDPSRPVPYQPENFSRTYHGRVTLRAALEGSINIVAVKLLQRIGYEPVLDVARKLGVQSPLRRYPSLALGAFETSLLEVTSAYGAFAHGGLLIEPHHVLEVIGRGGRSIHRSRPGVSEAVSPQVAHAMNMALAGVIRHGTGRRAGGGFEQALAGKTGTTDDNSDAWFVGYTPRLVVGVWVGHDEPRSLGPGETGARAALPIWIDFMQRALAGADHGSFEQPPGIVVRTIDPSTGELYDSTGECTRRLREVFVAGTEPAVRCTPGTHRRLELPYPFHRYEVDPSGALRVHRDDLDGLLDFESDMRFRRRRRRLESFGPLGAVRMPVRLIDGASAEPDSRLRGDLDPTLWRGTDGRPARVIWWDSRR